MEVGSLDVTCGVEAGWGGESPKGPLALNEAPGLPVTAVWTLYSRA